MPDEESELEEIAEQATRARLPAFDSDFSPSHPQNQIAAAARGLRYDTKNKVYRDYDGYPVLDKFGQALD